MGPRQALFEGKWLGQERGQTKVIVRPGEAWSSGEVSSPGRVFQLPGALQLSPGKARERAWGTQQVFRPHEGPGWFTRNITRADTTCQAAPTTVGSTDGLAAACTPTGPGVRQGV